MMSNRQKTILFLALILTSLVVYRYSLKVATTSVEQAQTIVISDEIIFNKPCIEAGERSLLSKDEEIKDVDTVNNEDNEEDICPIRASKCLKENECSLVAVILVRIYENDTASWSRHHLDQWIRYMFYAGVNHIHLYDNFKSSDEKLRSWLATKYDPSYVTYHDWSRPWYSYPEAQRHAYQDAINRYKTGTTWQIALDMDEYPVAPGDSGCGFLIRAIEGLNHRDTTELSIKTLLLVGEPVHNEVWIVSRYRRRMKKTIMELDKPIYRPAQIRDANVHHNTVLKGESVDVDPKLLRINHYWGPREQWGENTPKLMRETVQDDSIQNIIDGLDRTVRCKDFRIP